MSNQNDKWQMTRHDKATRPLIKKKKNLISQLQGSYGKRYQKSDGAFGIWQHCFFFLLADRFSVPSISQHFAILLMFFFLFYFYIGWHFVEQLFRESFSKVFLCTCISISVIFFPQRFISELHIKYSYKSWHANNTVFQSNCAPQWSLQQQILKRILKQLRGKKPEVANDKSHSTFTSLISGHAAAN